MPAVARGRQTDVVLSLTGSGHECKRPTTTTTGVAEHDKVKIGGIGVVVESDAVGPHSKSGCSADTSTLSTFSTKVKAGGKGIARIGDQYSSDNIITSGSTKIFIQ
jgi:uncharacterized Zn-binding protein involved in type VI secretion